MIRSDLFSDPLCSTGYIMSELIYSTDVKNRSSHIFIKMCAPTSLPSSNVFPVVCGIIKNKKSLPPTSWEHTWFIHDYFGLCHFFIDRQVGERKKEERDHDQTQARFKSVSPTWHEHRIPSYLSFWIFLYLVTCIHGSAYILKDTHRHMESL